MKFLSHFVLLLCLISFTACTTLTGAERCALLGQVQTGTHIGSAPRLGQIGSTLYSYNTTTYNPVCAFPKTEEEKKLVEELTPKAQEKKSKRNKEYAIYYVGFGLLGLLAVMAASGDSSNTDYYPYYY